MTTLFLVMQGYVAAAATCFCIAYHLTARWWESAIGRNIMLLVGSIAAILDLALVWNLVGRPGWMRILFALLYVCIGSAIWWRLWILLKAQYVRGYAERDKR